MNETQYIFFFQKKFSVFYFNKICLHSMSKKMFFFCIKLDSNYRLQICMKNCTISQHLQCRWISYHCEIVMTCYTFIRYLIFSLKYIRTMVCARKRYCVQEVNVLACTFFTSSSSSSSSCRVVCEQQHKILCVYVVQKDEVYGKFSFLLLADTEKLIFLLRYEAVSIFN